MSWKKNWALMGGLAMVAVCFGPTRAASAQKLVECPRVYYDSDKTCNCSSLDVDIEICHEEFVVVSFAVGGGIANPSGGAGGGRALGTSTGKSSGTCASATVPPGMCIWWRYGFECCPENGLFFTHWACTPTGASIHSGPATPDDCGP